MTLADGKGISTNPTMDRSLALPTPVPAPATRHLALLVLIAIAASHLLNDLMQSVLVAVYPMVKDAYQLTFTQIGTITLTNQVTASLLQPLVGWHTDRRPVRYALSIGMGFTFAGLLLLSSATSFPALLAAAALVGVGSSVFHPEASRIARLSSAASGWPSRSSRSAAISARRSGPCSPPWSSCPAAKARSPGARWAA